MFKNCSNLSNLTINTSINTGCGLSVVSLWTGLSVFQTSEAIWLYTLRYHSISFDRFFGCFLFRVLCLLKRFVHHVLPPLQKCNYLRDQGHTYKLPDLWPPNSPDLNPIDYKIWVTIQQRIQSTKVQDVKDLMQRLIDAWAGVEEMSLTIGVGISIPVFSHRRILWIFTVAKISIIIKKYGSQFNNEVKIYC